MMDNDKIIRAADQYVDHTSDVDEDAYALAKREAFIEGAKWFKNALWHKASEEPEFNRRLITQHITLMGELGYDLDTNIPKFSWELNVEDAHIIKWCYIEDILPKGGEK